MDGFVRQILKSFDNEAERYGADEFKRSFQDDLHRKGVIVLRTTTEGNIVSIKVNCTVIHISMQPMFLQENGPNKFK